MATIKLVRPEWVDVPEYCPGCSYALQGLSTPGRCPECGLPFDDQTMTVIGIPRRSATISPWRRVAWIVLFVTGYVGSQLFVLLVAAPLLLLAFVILWVTGLIYMLKTSKRERSATQPIIFSAGGFGIASDDDYEAGNALVNWTEVNTYRLKRISHRWYHLKLGKTMAYDPLDHSAKLGNVKFEMGFACTEEDEPFVRETLQHHLDHQSWAG